MKSVNHYINPIDFINSEITPFYQAKLVHAVTNAYKDSIRIVNNTVGLNWDGGKEIIPYIRKALIEYEVKELCENKFLPFDFRMAPNKIDNCRHLEVRTENFILTFSHVHKINYLPRTAIFRKDLSIFNDQISLFDNEREFNGPYHLILTHGIEGEKPEFICLGMPESQNRAWKVNLNLSNRILNVMANDSDVVNIEDDIGLEVKKEYLLKQGVLKNGKY